MCFEFSFHQTKLYKNRVKKKNESEPLDLLGVLIVSVRGTTCPEVAGEELPEALFLKEDTNALKEVC